MNPYVRGGSFNDPLTIRYRVTQEGDFINDAGSGGPWLNTIKTVEVTRAAGTEDISIPITDDDISEADGKITVEVLPGSGYLIEESRNPAFAIVRDDDPTSVSFGGTNLAVVEGSDDTYTAVLHVVPAPHQDITVRLGIQEPLRGRWARPLAATTRAPASTCRSRPVRAARPSRSARPPPAASASWTTRTLNITSISI